MLVYWQLSAGSNKWNIHKASNMIIIPDWIIGHAQRVLTYDTSIIIGCDHNSSDRGRVHSSASVIRHKLRMLMHSSGTTSRWRVFPVTADIIVNLVILLMFMMSAKDTIVSFVNAIL